MVSVTTINAFAWYFGSSVIDWKSFLGGDFYEQTLNDPQGRRVYSKLLSCCTDKLSQAFWPSLLQG